MTTAKRQPASPVPVQTQPIIDSDLAVHICSSHGTLPSSSSTMKVAFRELIKAQTENNLELYNFGSTHMVLVHFPRSTKGGSPLRAEATASCDNADDPNRYTLSM
eukprot:4761546-Amphidinium_carterae.1